MNAIEVVHCARCGIPCRKMPGNPDARLLRRTAAAGGLCANCCATEFLQSLPVIAAAGERNRPFFNPECFLMQHVQEHFSAVMAAGKSDASPEEIDWLKIIANWNLPFPKRARRRRK